MRELDALTDAAYPTLARDASAIRGLPSLPAQDALAKMELGLAVQRPFGATTLWSCWRKA